jgi:hypothetical protein
MYASFWLDVSSGATIVLLEAALFATVALAGPDRWRRQAGAAPAGLGSAGGR